jgi:hypothetical protein
MKLYVLGTMQFKIYNTDYTSSIYLYFIVHYTLLTTLTILYTFLNTTIYQISELFTYFKKLIRFIIIEIY